MNGRLVEALTGVNTVDKPKKSPIRSKTMWLNALVAGLGALETAAPGTVPAGPALIAISVAGAVLRALTTQPVR